MSENHIEITQRNGSGIGTTVKLNGKNIKAKSVSYDYYDGELPSTTIEMIGDSNTLDILGGDVIIDICPTNLQNAIIILKNELQKHTDLYDAFRASIQSALDDVPCKLSAEYAEHILKRIIGEE